MLMSFDEITVCNERMSFFEMLLFCRDFDVVPALISKQELACVWKQSVIRHITHGDPVVGPDHVVEHSFALSEFVHLLASIAVVAFSARSADAAVDALISHLHLDSPLHARKTIQTKGRETQRRLNFRSAGERDKQTPQELLHETRTHLRRKAANAASAAQARAKKHAVSEPLDDANSSDDDAHFVDFAPCEYTARRPRSAPATRRDGARRKPARTGSGLSALVRNVPSNCLTDAQEKALASVSSALSQRLTPFLTDASLEHWSPFSGLLIDLGTLQRSREYHARIDVRNVSPRYITIDSVAPRNGALACVASTSYVPGQLAPGLSRIIDVKITPAKGDAYKHPEVADFVDIRIGALTIPVPLYYRICTPDRTNAEAKGRR